MKRIALVLLLLVVAGPVRAEDPKVFSICSSLNVQNLKWNVSLTPCQKNVVVLALNISGKLRGWGQLGKFDQQF